LADLLGTEIGGRWLRFAGLRWLVARPVPVCWTEIFVAEPYFAVRDQDGQGPIYDRIRRRFGLEIREVEQRVTATAMPADIAPLLNAEPNTPALVTRRRYFAEGTTPFEVSLSLHPGDRYAFTQRLHRANSAAGRQPSSKRGQAP
jgi:DNA-binding GntR family transcriptional regulator